MDEIEEIVYYISEMKRSFNRKLDDHLFIIEQQNNKINEQAHIIDELAWQLRDLRDSVRQLGINLKTQCKCNYENHIPRTPIAEGNIIRQQQQQQDTKAKTLAPPRSGGLKLSLPGILFSA